MAEGINRDTSFQQAVEIQLAIGGHRDIAEMKHGGPLGLLVTRRCLSRSILNVTSAHIAAPGGRAPEEPSTQA
jgi:hypothetical protein